MNYLLILRNYLRSHQLTLRYWAIWLALLATLAYGFHRYMEYRNQQLDKRLQEIKMR